jgi:hypothetical protein
MLVAGGFLPAWRTHSVTWGGVLINAIAHLGRCSDSIGSACMQGQRSGENQNKMQQGPPGDVNRGAALRRPRCHTLLAVMCCARRQVVLHRGYAHSEIMTKVDREKRASLAKRNTTSPVP